MKKILCLAIALLLAVSAFAALAERGLTRLCSEGGPRLADALAQAYFAQYDKIAAQEKAQIVGHFDLITKFDEQRAFFNPGCPQYKKAALAAMEKLVNAGKIFEVNTGAISRGYRTTPYPSRELLLALREMGGRVTVSADAHHTSGVACAFDAAEKLIRECGFTEIWLLSNQNGQSAFIPVSF